MAVQKPSIPKGTRDFSPEEVSKRQYIFDTIRHQFQLHGYAPIETPSFENLSTLTGKYGEEGDRLIFKILNSGEFSLSLREIIQLHINFCSEFKTLIENSLSSSKIESSRYYQLSEEERINLREIIKEKSLIKGHEIVEKIPFYANTYINFLNSFFEGKFELVNRIVEYYYDSNFDEAFENFLYYFQKYFEENFLVVGKLTSQISEKALRYDLTVPFARYVVQHQNEITFPFKRYQIQPVWRADRPQKGRFREFYQCDADVVGSDSLLQEVELVSLYDAVFSELNVPVEIHFNNRKILSGLAEVADISNQLIDFTVALDKLDKIGEEKVKEEMLQKGISETAIQKLSPLFSMSGDFNEQLNSLEQILNTSETGMKGIEEVRFVFDKIETLGLNSAELILNLTLARGLDYYTGAILEVKAKNVELGSIGGGGRYDDLTGIFGLNGISGVGISFGLDRIYLVLEELNLFPESIENSLDVLFINFGENESAKAMKLAKQLRAKGLRCEVYPDNAKMKKQMQYADKKAVKYVIIIGEEEFNSQKITVKNMVSGEQNSIPDEELTQFFNTWNSPKR